MRFLFLLNLIIATQLHGSENYSKNCNVKEGAKLAGIASGVAWDSENDAIYAQSYHYNSDGTSANCSSITKLTAQGTPDQSFGEGGQINLKGSLESGGGKSMLAKNGVVRGVSTGFFGSVSSGYYTYAYQIVNGAFDQNFGSNGVAKRSSPGLLGYDFSLSESSQSFGEVLSFIGEDGIRGFVAIDSQGTSSRKFPRLDSNEMQSFHIDAMGNRYVLSSKNTGNPCSKDPILLTKYDSSGQVDQRYGEYGVVSLSHKHFDSFTLGNTWETETGKTLVSIIETFEQDGFCWIDERSALVHLDRDGKILAESDPFYGNVGGVFQKSALAIDMDGNFYLSNEKYIDGGSYSKIHRYSRDLKRDNTFEFSLDNYTVNSFVASMGVSLAISSDGGLFVAGCYYYWDEEINKKYCRPAIGKVTPAGLLDKSFGSDGIAFALNPMDTNR